MKKRNARDRDSDVSATLMKRHDGLDFESVLLSHLKQLSIPTPIVRSSRLSLHQSPPHVHHDPLHSGTLQRLQTRVHRFPPVHRVVHRHAVQRHHHVNRHPLSLLILRTPRSVLYAPRRRRFYFRREGSARHGEIRSCRSEHRRSARAHRRRRREIHGVWFLDLASETRRRRFPHRRCAHRRSCLG